MSDETLTVLSLTGDDIQRLSDELGAAASTVHEKLDIAIEALSHWAMQSGQLHDGMRVDIVTHGPEWRGTYTYYYRTNEGTGTTPIFVGEDREP